MEEAGVNQISMEAPPVCEYTDLNFLFTTTSNHGQEGKSGLDSFLISQWEVARDAGLLSYGVDDVETKVLPGRYEIVTQLNVNREKKRRTPETIVSVVQANDPSKFNFTKINPKEIVAELCLSQSHMKEIHGACNSKEDSNAETDLKEDTKHKTDLKGTLIINTAPICPNHSLLVPNLTELKSQVVDYEGLTLAVHSALLSSTPDFRVGFNSLAGFASVNHLHFHAYYLPYKLFIETAECKRLAGPCYVFNDYHSPGFVFQLENQNVAELLCSAMKVVKLFLEEEIAHNIFITRGTPLEDSSSSDTYTTLRLIIWGRKPAYGMKNVFPFAAAVCEFAGHVPVYSNDGWSELTEDNIMPTLEEACRETYLYLLPKVRELFSKKY